MVWGWYQHYNYIQNLFFSLITIDVKIMAFEIIFTKIINNENTKIVTK